MKSKILSTLSYTGVVTLSRYTGSKKIELAQLHNTGGSELFNFISDCFLGNFSDAENERPTKIKVLNYSIVEGSYTYTSASGFVHLLTKPEKISKDNQSCIRYSFLIPRDVINNIANTERLALGLYSKKSLNDESVVENFSAVCDITSAKNLFNNTSLVVDWELIITNSK